MTDQSERLVPRYSDANTLTMAEKAARHIAEKQDYEWDNQDEAWQKDRIQQALSFLEAAGVERLRAELESCRSVNAALTSKLEGEKSVSKLLRDWMRQVAVALHPEGGARPTYTEANLPMRVSDIVRHARSLTARIDELMAERATDKAAIVERDKEAELLEERVAAAERDRAEQKERADRLEKTEPLRPAKGRAYHCAVCGKDHSGSVPEEWQCECGGVVIDPNLMHPHTEEQQKARADAAEEKLKAERAKWSKRLMVLDELRNDLAPEFLQPQEDDYAIPNAVRELFHLWQQQRDELEREKARADRAEQSRLHTEELAFAAAHRIAALEKVVEAAREVNADVMVQKGCASRSTEENALYDALRALDSAQPAQDAGKCAQPSEHHESCNCENQPAPDARDERTLSGLTDAEREQLKQDYERLQAEQSLRSERIRELESEMEVVREVSANTSRANESILQREEETNERIRVACAELRRMSASVHEMGYHSTAADLSRIARELEGKDSANIDSGQPAGTPSTGPGQSLGGQEPAGCPSPLPVSTELLGRLRRAKSVDIIIRKDGVERRYQADWLKTMARAQKDSGQPAGTGVPQGAREGHSSSGGLRSEMQAEAQLQHAKETRAQEETPAGCSSPLKSTLHRLAAEHAARPPEERRKAEALGNDVAPIPGRFPHDGGGERRAEPVEHETPWRVGSQVPQNVYDAKDRPVAQFHDNGTAMRVVEAVNRNELDADYWREAKADLRMLCIIAAQFETTQPQMQPLSEKLNGPERNAGPEYAIRLVERVRGRLETR